jgi:hypothetical protein
MIIPSGGVCVLRSILWYSTGMTWECSEEDVWQIERRVDLGTLADIRNHWTALVSVMFR